MAEKTKIQWADGTFNPWIGCTKVSPGCANCYAENTTRARVLRSQGHETWGKGKQRSRTSAATWKNPVKWNEKPTICDLCGLVQPIHNFKCLQCDERYPRRQRVFPSLCDWLDAEVPIEWLADFLNLIRTTPNIDWLLLTKRPENFCGRLFLAGGFDLNRKGEGEGNYHPFYFWITDWLKGKAPQNVWVGTSCEDQTRADERVPQLLSIPAKVRFLSVEPLLGPIKFRTPADFVLPGSIQECGIHWVIAGGESGGGARACHVKWIRDIVGQCKDAGVTPFVKQLGSVIHDRNDSGFEGDDGDWPMGTQTQEIDTGYQGAPVRVLLRDKKGGDISEWPEDLRVREFPSVTQI